MKTLQVQLADDLFEAAEALAAQTRESPDEYMSAALRAYVKRRATTLRASSRERASPDALRDHLDRIADHGDRELERSVFANGAHTLRSVEP